MLFRLILLGPFLLLTLNFIFTQDVDVSGEWVDNAGKTWTLTQQADRVLLVREDKWCRFAGQLEGRAIKYKTYLKILSGPFEGCEEYVGVDLYYDAKLVFSDDGTRLVNVVPDKVIRGSCEIQMKVLPEFWITRKEASER